LTGALIGPEFRPDRAAALQFSGCITGRLHCRARRCVGGRFFKRFADSRFNDNVRRTADQDQMFDIVPAYEDQAAMPIDGHGVCHGEAGRAAFAANDKQAFAVTAYHQPSQPKKGEHKQQCRDRRHDRTNCRAEQLNCRFVHRSPFRAGLSH
jgi:hypothetical protein